MKTNQQTLRTSLLILLLVTVIAESALFRRRRDVVEQYGLNLESIGPQSHPHHRIRRHQQSRKIADGKHPRVCYFSPIQCLFTRSR
ncbi:hypothetical protein AAVH_38683 [Aphelenchoides avenae]|nr:hypothetical protein AAVH_38683 [Aphelenchus avenae]